MKTESGLAADVLGEGPALVLVHGMGSSRRAWRPVLGGLAEHFTVYAFDLPGHGESKALPKDLLSAKPKWFAEQLVPELDRLRDEHGDVHYAGNSMGGWIGLELAAMGALTSYTGLAPAGLERMPWPELEPKLVRRKQLVDALGPLVGPSVQLVRLMPVLREILMADASADPRSIDIDLLIGAAEALRDSTGYVQSMRGMLRHRFTKRHLVPESTPVSIVFGDHDVLLPYPEQDPSLSPTHAEWVLLSRCGHVPMWDRPKETIEVICSTAGFTSHP